jgi:uncharacterized surface protein with fasciclin (FAS1) repeats
MNIIETAVSNGSFKTLVAAVKVADLEDALTSEGPFTVFAPTDDAFGKLPDGIVNALIKPENKDLTSILTYHVLVGKNYVDRFIRWYESHNGERRRSNGSFKEGRSLLMTRK